MSSFSADSFVAFDFASALGSEKSQSLLHCLSFLNASCGISPVGAIAICGICASSSPCPYPHDTIWTGGDGKSEIGCESESAGFGLAGFAGIGWRVAFLVVDVMVCCLERACLLGLGTGTRPPIADLRPNLRLMGYGKFRL